jgi:2-polyprenyl-6-methoxyphenol hydroxylase-like FAD-dependent oxidoreductase
VEGSEPSAPNNQDTLSHDPSAVRAVLSRPDGRLELVSTPRLIRAEGAHSTIRATFDLAFEGNTFNQQYAPGDLHADAEPAESDSIFFFGTRIHGHVPAGRRPFPAHRQPSAQPPRKWRRTVGCTLVVDLL